MNELLEAYTAGVVRIVGVLEAVGTSPTTVALNPTDYERLDEGKGELFMIAGLMVVVDSEVEQGNIEVG
jgi:hypothetical protein